MRAVAMVLGGLCVLGAAFLVVVGQMVQAEQTKVGWQQDEINKGTHCQQVGTNLLRDMGQVAIGNERMRGLLKRHGYTLNMAPGPSAGPAANPGVAPPASPGAGVAPRAK